MNFYRSLLTLLLSTFMGLSACVKADRSRSANTSEEVSAFGLEKNLAEFNNRALFEAGNIELEDIQFSRASTSSFVQVDQIRLWLKVCNLRDQASQGILRNERFHISSEIGDSIYMTRDTNDAGDTELVSTEISNPIHVNQANCLRWSQLIPAFNFMANSANIAIHYEISSVAGTLGKIIRRVGFNPWDMYRNNSRSRGFRDLTDHGRSDWGEGQWVTGQTNVIAALKGELFDNEAQLSMRALTVQALERENQNGSPANQDSYLESLSPQERQRYLSMRQEIEASLRQQNGLQINVNMSARPFVRVQDSTGVPHDIDLDTGRFRIHMNLVAARATEGAQKFLLSSNVSQITGRGTAFTWDINQNGLLASVPLVLRNNCQNCRMELAIKIEPVSQGLRQIKPFAAVYDLGEYDAWMRRQTPEFRFDENFRPMNMVGYDEYISGLEGSNADVTTLRPQERFYFGPLTIRFVRIMPGESATDRTLQYRVESCVQHGLYGNRVGRGLQFEVITEDQGRQHRMVRQTNEAGCLMWFGFLSHKYYRKEVLQEKHATIRYLGSRSQVNERGEREAVDETGEMVNRYERRFTYYMNPWDEKFTFGWDEPDMPDGYVQEIRELQNTAPVSKLFIADFRYQTMGFRYEIDRFLRLKVKKAILFQTYPYVLKYNSIVEGRQRTEKLRDGIYLMKVALHKYYLDPAARGVLIYDENNEDPFNYAEEDPFSPNIADDPNFVERERQGTYDLFDEIYGPSFESGGRSPRPRMTDANGRDVDYRTNFRLLDDNDLGESKKEYISHQTKLVRVQGGQIITPIEFDMHDLRLMRIRNQFLIQLETIDERVLRQATFIDATLNDMNQQGNIEQRFAEIFSEMDEIERIEDAMIQTRLDEYDSARERQEAEERLRQLNITLEEARERINRIFGLDQFEEGSEAYQAHIQAIEQRLGYLREYRERVQEVDGLNYENMFRNQKRSLINSIMRRLGQDNRQSVDRTIREQSRESRVAVEEDPFLRYMFMDNYISGTSALNSLVDYRAQRAEEMGDPSFAVDLRTLQLADFTETPLTASFDFDMLRNDGEHNHRLAEDDGKSGLPSRTFVGPLTFVFNTNGSALRPTDILNERVCPTAFCETPQRLIHDLGVPPSPVERAAELDEQGNFLDLGSEPIYSMGESVNKDYENNEYYGYLKIYAGVKVDDLIAREQQIRELDYRRMEQGSQIINFVSTFDLKYTLLNDSNPRSHLKSINHECAENIEIDRLQECFTPITSGPQILTRDRLLSQLNEREPVLSQDLFPNVNSRRERHNATYYNLLEGDITANDIESLMARGWANPEMSPDLARKFMHRMCYVLTQNLLKENYLRGAPVANSPAQDPYAALVYDAELEQRYRNQSRLVDNHDLLQNIEERCHRYVGRIYNYYPDRDSWTGAFRWESRGIERARQSGLRPQLVDFNPIVMERKVRVYKTTDRYVYRGGKSLNINVSANFNLNAGEGIKVSTSSTYKPWETAVSIGGAVIGLAVGGPVGGAIGLAAASSIRAIVGAVTLTRSVGRDESVYANEGVSVAAGTFLVNQQATFDIEFGEYERCMIVRLHPMFISDVLNDEPKLQGQGGLRQGAGHFADNIESQGILICSGQTQRQCLPVKEKYYYFTQHFTEGDMLDTADLHNHPWLLQMRGYRDFQAFTALIGAQDMGLDNDWVRNVLGDTISDAAAFRMQGSRVDNLRPNYQVINRNSETNWSLDELGRVYFSVLPTFPSLYTYIDETGQNVSEWPYQNTNPGQAFQQCEP
jgi:hypothetical protein